MSLLLVKLVSHSGSCHIRDFSSKYPVLSNHLVIVLEVEVMRSVHGCWLPLA